MVPVDLWSLVEPLAVVNTAPLSLPSVHLPDGSNGHTAWASGSCLWERCPSTVCKVQSPGSTGLCRLGPCYLSRPSALTGPSSDLGSGDRELQLVSLQSSREGQADGPMAHNPATDQKLLNSLSVQASSSGPVSSACLRAASSWASG